MKSFTILAYFMAFLAIMCGSGYAKSTRLQRRAPPVIPFPLPDKVNAVVDLIIQEHAAIAINAYANVCTDADIESAVKSNLRLTVSGLFDIDFGITSKIATKVDAAIKTQVKATLDSEINVKLTANLKADVQNILFTQCPLGDLACIKLNANIIVDNVVNAAIKATQQITAELHTKLQTDIDVAIKAEVKKFSVNLWLVKINVTGGVEINNALAVKFNGALEVSQKAFVTIKSKLVSKIRAVYE